ncbi:MAG: type II toxin-antitoxin system VapC family toxin [Chloroflexi bacterium]|nr:type II toxin-antitoxin system VapC family toxin [Chloroflexota bacterium]
MKRRSRGQILRSLLFLDTSALIKLHLLEVGSSWLKSFIAGNQISISELALYESATVLRRRYLEGSITQPQALALYAQLQQESQSYDVIELRSERQLERVVALAFSLPQNLRIRALDSIHLVAAQISKEAANRLVPPEPFVFVSSDRQLLQVAQSQNLVTENPEDHP